MDCKIYLHSDLDEKELESKFLYWLDARLDTFTIITDSYEISLCENDEFSLRNISSTHSSKCSLF